MKLWTTMLLVNSTAVLAAVLFVSTADAGPAVGDQGPVMAAAAPGTESTSPRLESTGPSVAGRPGNQEFQARLARWRALSPDEQKRLKERYEAWQKLPDSEKRALRDRMEAWNRLSPDARQQYIERFRQYGRMSPQDHERMRGHWEAWNRMTPEQKRLARRVAAVLKELPKDQLQRLKGMPLEERKVALRKMLADRGIQVSPLPPSGGPGNGEERGADRRRMRPGPDGRERSGDFGIEMRRRGGLESSESESLRLDSSAPRGGLRGSFRRGGFGERSRHLAGESSDAGIAPDSSTPAGNPRR